MFGIIYKATNTANGKVYIGQTTYTLAQRKANHCFRAKVKDRRTIFQVALIEFGTKSFTWEQIETADSQEELDQKEIYWIGFYKSSDFNYGYNDQSGGTCSTLSTSHRKKISEAAKKQWENPEVREKMIKGRKGRVPSPETRKKLSEARKGKHPTPETLQKLSEIRKGRVPWNKGLKMKEVKNGINA
jgi:group I intron endonuclease